MCETFYFTKRLILIRYRSIRGTLEGAISPASQFFFFFYILEYILPLLLYKTIVTNLKDKIKKIIVDERVEEVSRSTPPIDIIVWE